MSGTVRVIPLGGLGEVGKNIMVIEDDDDMIVIDCGLTFPREEGMFGVDIVLPDFTYIVERSSKLRAVVLTHGHEDHIGALPYLMRQCEVPAVYGTRFTLALVKSKADEHGLINATEWCELVPEEGGVEIGSFDLELVRVAHSIPDCVAIAVHTGQGTILHTGDLRLDPAPLDGVRTDLGHFAEVGAEGVDLYLADSTNADIPGHSRSEQSIAGPLRDIVSRSRGRVIVSCFSSHIHRIQQMIDIAQENGRAVCILGRSMMRNTNIARNLGYMDVGGARIVKPHQLEELDPSEIMVICTGSQGEPLAAMNRIAWGTHPTIRPQGDDVVIFSSRTIPGNEVRVHRLINQLSRIGAHIYHQDNARVHVSGHAYSEELSTMLQLVRPSAFMPVHGEWRHLRAHADLARLVGVAEEHIIMGDNGVVVELREGVATLSEETVHVGQRLVDRHSNEDIMLEVMEDRQQLSGDGLLVVVARVDVHDATGTLEVIPRGFIDGSDDVIEDARRAAESALDEVSGTRFELDRLQKALQETVSSVVYDRTRRSPLVVPVVVED